MLLQDKLEAKLAHEVEKNKDNILESENLTAQYEDRAAQYDVSNFGVIGFGGDFNVSRS